MNQPTAPELMKLLETMTGWGSHLRLSLSYYEVRSWIAQDESVGTGVRKFGVATTICGNDKLSVSGSGDTFEAALMDLAKGIPEKIRQSEHWYVERAKGAEAALKDFLTKKQ